MRNLATSVALAATALAFAGCGSDSNAPDMSHVGHYELLSVDSDPLPVTVLDVPGYVLEVTAGSLALEANNTYVQTITLVETTDGVKGPSDAIACSGRYTRHGSTLTLTTPETDVCVGQTVTGTLNGSDVTIDYDGTKLLFRR